MTPGGDRQDARAVSFDLNNGTQLWNVSWGDNNTQFPQTIETIGDRIFLSYMDGVPWGRWTGTSEFDQGFTEVVEINNWNQLLKN